MFSNNEHITKVQLFKMIILNMFGITSLLFPTVLAGYTGRDGIFSIVLGTFTAMLFLLPIFWIIKRMRKSYLGDLKDRYGGLIFRVVGILFLIQFFLVALISLLLLGEVVNNTLLTNTSRELIGFLFLAICTYASFYGVEERARLVDALFYIVLILLLFLLLFSLREVRIDYLFPLAIEPSRNIIYGGYYVFAVSSSLNMLLILSPYIKESSTVELAKIEKRSFFAVLITGIINLLIYLIVLGAFGVIGTSVQPWPLITLMNIIKVPGGFIERLDAVMIGVWILSIFSLISACISNNAVVFKEMAGKGKYSFWVAISSLLIYIAYLFTMDFKKAYEWYEIYLLNAGAPIAVGIPLIFILADYIYLKIERRNQDESV